MTDEGKWKILATADPHEVKITITGEFKVEDTEFSGELQVFPGHFCGRQVDR